MVRIDFLKLSPRVGRIRFLGLMIFWPAALWLLTSIILKTSFGLISAAPEAFSFFAILLLCIFGIASILIAINTIFLYIRRLNDTGSSGWKLVLTLIPLIGWIYSIYIFCASGEKGKNKYGPPPAKPTKWDYLLILLVVPCMIYLSVLLIEPTIEESERMHRVEVEEDIVEMQ